MKSVTRESINTELTEAKFPLDFQDFVSENITDLAKLAYEKAITRNRKIIVGVHECLAPADVKYDLNGNVISIKGHWATDLSYVDLSTYRQHLINLYGEQDAIDSLIEAAETILDLVDPDRECLLYLQQGIFLPDHDLCWKDLRFISNVVTFPIALSDWERANFVSTTSRKPRKQPEQILENELCNWLKLHGVDVERQIATKSNHRLDLWIPGRMMLELKAGKVTGDDICQAIDYHATYERPIILIGKGLSSAASRGMDGLNRAIDHDAIVFVTWSAAKAYIKGALNLGSYVTG